MKTRLNIQLTLLLLALVLSLTVTSCSAIIAARQTNPNGWTPTAVERWWMEQQLKR